jgi:uncharacterized protein YpmB
MKKSKQFYVAEGILLRVNDVLFGLNDDQEENRIHVRAKCEQLLSELSYAGIVTNDERKELVERIGGLPFKEKPKGETT